jgi:FAD/FMN-containing dehydrogenase
VTSRPVHHTERPLDELRASLRGDLISPDSDEYDEARRVWNGTIDRRPALVARCLGVADVISALRVARNQDLTVAVRGGGHNVAGFSTCDGGMVIDLSRMTGVRVDLGTRTARAEGGLTWGAFDHETQAFGLATTGGLVTSTGIGGLTLGGGIGWLMRKHGLTADNLVAADVVTADSELITANTDVESELLWGLRGGGGNFGVVTSFEYQLHAVGPMVLGGALLHPADRARDLLGFYAEWTRSLPEELTTLFAFLTAPPEPFIPAELQGTPMVAVALCYTGRIDEGEATLRPLRELAAPAVDVVMPHALHAAASTVRWHVAPRHPCLLEDRVSR